jgi:hypothetical protein
MTIGGPCTLNENDARREWADGLANIVFTVGTRLRIANLPSCTSIRGAYAPPR